MEATTTAANTAFNMPSTQQPAPCPSCGHCPTCGRGGNNTGIWWTQPQVTWTLSPMGIPCGSGHAYENTN